jgi:UbiD family decarboxylase
MNDKHKGTETPRHRDLRELLDRIDAMGELQRLSGVDWNLEMGALSEMVCQRSKEGRSPALLFENIPGVAPGFRVLSGATNSTRRLAYALGFPEPDRPTDVVRAYRDRMRTTFALIPPAVVSTGPVLENVDRDGDVDLYKFPVPWLHEHDGGRYIGTEDVVSTRDPDSDWVNSATYRLMVHDRNTCGIWMSPGKHGRLIREKYFARGEPCPVTISVGQDPLLFMAANQEIDYGTDELAYAGGHRGSPVEIVRSELHGLPIPAASEIVLEGEIYGDRTMPEGPFGEFMGYYASSVSDEPVVKIRRVYYRNDPILCLASPARPPNNFSFARSIVKAAMIWDEVEKAGLPGVAGVFNHEAGAGRLFNVIAIKQLYPGHAKQAGMLAANCHAGNYAGRWTIVVDEDIDPSNLFDVIWAVSTRCDPVEDIDFVRGAWSTPLDTLLEGPPYQSNRAIVDACRPWSRKDRFPRVAEASPELRARMAKKFHELFDRL